MAVTEKKRRIARRAGLPLCLLLAVGLAAAWRFWPSPPPCPAPDQDELKRALFVAIRDGDHTQVRDLLDQGADVEARYEAGDTALNQAALNADTSMIH